MEFKNLTEIVGQLIFCQFQTADENHLLVHNKAFRELEKISSLSEALLLVGKERKEQIEKHNFTIEGDMLENSNGELTKAAKYILNNNDMTWPKSWTNKWKAKIDAKDDISKLIVAAALLLAEVDRQILIKKNQ